MSDFSSTTAPQMKNQTSQYGGHLIFTVLGTRGLRHIALTVDNLNDLTVDIEEVRTDWFGKRFTFTKDIDDQPIELKERGYRR